jgi:SAM-dependent methyltransferase
MLDDVELFLRLNEEYASKPLVPTPPRYDADTLLRLGRRRASELDAAHQIRGKRVLEIGCGYGETARALASELGCTMVAVDISPYLPEKWAEFNDCGVDFRLFDVTKEDPSLLGKFDFIYSNGTLEHVEHPFALLSALLELIPAGGRMHFNMGLHRGTIGSHLYRDVFFPWPHLLFTESTFERFYERTGRPAQRPCWINHITAAQWLEMFDVLGLHPAKVWYLVRPLDRSFYDRFENVLNRYPTYDLERDLMYIDLVKPHEHELLSLIDAKRSVGTTLGERRIEALQNEVVRVERIAVARLDQLREQGAKLEALDELGQAVQAFRGLSSDLQQKTVRLQTIEERLNKDLRGVRKLGRAVTWAGSTLQGLIQPVSAVRNLLSGGGSNGHPPDQPR